MEIRAGQAVGVYTRSGRLVTTGTVGVVTAAGHMVREAAGAHWYPRAIYEVRAAVAEAAPHTVDDVPDSKADADARLGAPVRGDGAVRRRVADPDRLPADIQRAIRREVRLSGDQVEVVLGEVGRAALTGLRRAGVPEGSLHAVTAQVIEAARGVLDALGGEA